MDPEDKTVTFQILGNEKYTLKPNPLELCRLCANTDNQLIPIFKGEGLEHDIPSKLEKHLPIIKVTETDKLPLQICYQCASTLIAWHNFYEGSSVADKRLREILDVDEKYQDAGTYEDFGEDFRDDDFDQSHIDLVESIPLSTTSTNSQHEELNQNESVSEITQLKNSKILNETASENTTDERFVRQRMYEKTDASDTSDLFYVCSYCSKLYRSRGGIKNHIFHVHGNIVVDAMHASGECNSACHICINTFLSEDEKQRHLVRLRKICSILPIVESGTVDFELKENGDYVCNGCGKIFTRKFNLLRHERTHSTVFKMQSKCDLCGKKYSSPYTMKRHRIMVHKMPENKQNEQHTDAFDKLITLIDGKRYIKCDCCNYTCWQKSRFRDHYRRHTGERPYTCHQCGKQFRIKKFLVNHLRYVHEGIKEYPCDICGRCFSDKRYTEAHRRTHTGEKPFICDLCGRAFTQQASLCVHKEMHTKVPRHKCLLCHKTFFYRASLILHEKRHVGVLNHKCDVCSKAFVDKKHLRRHEVVHSEERPFICTLCGANFKLKKYLKQHDRTHRKI